MLSDCRLEVVESYQSLVNAVEPDVPPLQWLFSVDLRLLHRMIQ